MPDAAPCRRTQTIDRETATTEQPETRTWRRWLLVGLAVLGAAAAAGLALIGGLAAQEGHASGEPPRGAGAASPAATVPSSGALAWPAELIWPSDRTFKADQIERLGYAPEAVFFGGSRSRRLEPAYLEEKTGLRGFNLAMTNAKPEDAWAFAHFLHERSPETKGRWVWGIHVSTFMQRDLDPGLIQDPRLSRYLPSELLRAQAVLLPASGEDVPDVGRTARAVFAPDGVALFDTYDRAEARGRKLEEALAADLPRYRERLRLTPLAIGLRASRSLEYLEATVRYLEEAGDEVVLVAMPLHPTVLAALRAEGWQGRHDGLLAYVAGLGTRYGVEFIDLTELESFDGDPRDFYDAAHIKTANSRRVIDALVREFPETFRR